MVDLMYRERTFCQFFLSSETRKLTLRMMLLTNSSDVILTWPTATARHNTFFIWNLMVPRTSSILLGMGSLWVSRVGNLPALFRPGPRILGICLISDSDARKASYCLIDLV